MKEKPKKRNQNTNEGRPRCIELFSGAGGLALGVSKAGFEHLAIVEWDKHACNTIRFNKQKGFYPVVEWPLFECDARTFDYSPYKDKIDLVSGGPPCQPFSLGGKHRGSGDVRDMFPEAVRAIRELHPKGFIFENVKGLLRESFLKYFKYIVLQLTHPDLICSRGMSWMEHLSKLQEYDANSKNGGLYKVSFKLLNAANYGVPQKRERVIIVGLRSDSKCEWSFPADTHSSEALLWSQWVTGEYWERHGVPRKKRPVLSNNLKAKINNLKSPLFPPDTNPWTTVRDSLGDLPKPAPKRKTPTVPNHVYIPGARIYHGHSGSSIDEPAKALKAGGHGVPGGENTLLLPDGTVRYFTVRESARLQNFPDDFIFDGSWTECMRQIGNAVPVNLASVIANHMRSVIEASF